MKKERTIYCCTECGHKEPKWLGQCRECSQWNTFRETQTYEQESLRFNFQRKEVVKASPLKDLVISEVPRLKTSINEFDRLLGGGIVKGSFTLVGGDPGIGKSTLLLQAAAAIANQGATVLYISAEESLEQTYLRAQRLGIKGDINLLVLSETNFSSIKKNIEEINPDIVIVDSIQIIYKNDIPSAPGSFVQVREVATEFMHLAKGRGISIFLIGHVTKTGEIAGPKVLEHLVDTVLYFEGEKQQNFRLLRVVKNRFGATDEVAVFQMTGYGLAEVGNPSQFFLEERTRECTGTVVVATLEGSRTFLVEVQALVTDTIFSTPSRRASGIDQNRLALLLAVLEKRVGYPLHSRDVFVSLAGGIKITECAIDLGVLLAIISSYSNKVIPSNVVAIGEVGLSGEIRGIPRIEARLKEAIHLGFKKFFIPKRNNEAILKEFSSKIDIVPIEVVEEAIDALFV